MYSIIHPPRGINALVFPNFDNLSCWANNVPYRQSGRKRARLKAFVFEGFLLDKKKTPPVNCFPAGFPPLVLAERLFLFLSFFRQTAGCAVLADGLG